MDLYIFNLINQYAGKNIYFDGIAIFFAEYLQYFLALFFVFLLIKDFRKYSRLVLRMVAAAVLSRVIFTEIIRLIWDRSRPFVENNVNQLIEHSASSSMPSGHAAFFFAVSTALYLYNKKAGLVFFVASFLISLSRIFVGVHWPLDVLVGALIGIVSGWICSKLFKVC